jgi:mannose-6-phosphate isomerase-like protein (cupin superfamily)
MYKGDIETLTLNNESYRKVITTKQLQLVVMSIQPGQELGMEIHPRTSQFIRVESGSGTAYIGNTKYLLKDGDALVIPSGKKHNIIGGKHGLKLYSIYTPPEHSKKLIQKIKIE